MNINHQPKATLTAVNPDPDFLGEAAADVEVVPRATRRSFPKSEKRRILAELDRCSSVSAPVTPGLSAEGIAG